MTKPVLARRRSGREYLWPKLPPHELAVPSITTIIGGGIPKEALKFWAAKVTAEYAVQTRDAWVRLPEADAIDLIKRAPQRMTERRANVGNSVHYAIETYLGTGAKVPLDGLELVYYQGALAFLEEFQVEVLRVESTVFSRTHGYAGTLDLLYRSPALPGNVIGDWKTSKAVYDEMGLQLVAAAFADFIADPDGKTEIPLPKELEVGTVIRLARDGPGYEVVPFHFSQELFDLFLAAKAVAARELVLRASKGLQPNPPGSSAGTTDVR